jgi:hypothetical protein
MDADRQIRFLYPPLFLLASLAWGLWLDPGRAVQDIVPADTLEHPASAIVAVVAGGGVVVASLGFLINTIPWFLMRALATRLKKLPHEAFIAPDVLDSIRKILGYKGEAMANEALFLSATFDHSKLDKGIHAWILRRWNAFNLNASVAVGLGLALLLGARIGIHVGLEWGLTSAVAALMFATMAYWAWRDSMGMIEFQARLLADGDSAAKVTADP